MTIKVSCELVGWLAQQRTMSGIRWIYSIHSFVILYFFGRRLSHHEGRISIKEMCQLIGEDGYSTCMFLFKSKFPTLNKLVKLSLRRCSCKTHMSRKEHVHAFPTASSRNQSIHDIHGKPRVTVFFSFPSALHGPSGPRTRRSAPFASTH